MPIELTVPAAGESISEVYIGQWHKVVGERVEEGEVLVDLESDKATLELPAPVSGTLIEVRAAEGASVPPKSVIGLIDTEARESAGAGASQTAASISAPASATNPHPSADGDARHVTPAAYVMPAAQRMLNEAHLEARDVPATGPGNRLLKEDVVRRLEDGKTTPQTAATPAQPAPGRPMSAPPAQPAPQSPEVEFARSERVVPMSPIRLRIAERLVQAQQAAALLTTFNEVDMTQVIALRSEHRDAFQEKHGVKLGFMSFFVKATIAALAEIPQLNAEVRPTNGATQIVYRNYYDIGVAVGGGKGLVVPVLRNAERLSFAEIEKAIADFAERAKANQLTVEELQGGTFTISNGGVYGSLLSTPIVNPPQSGILGLHAIQDRPVALGGDVVVRKMMYVALTYDHRIVDGREAVTFLRRLKAFVESPARMLLEI